jgi:hypothetical protein
VTPEILAFVRSLENKIKHMDAELREIEGKLDVIEEQSCENRNRIKDLEIWQGKTDERLDKEL